MLSQFFIDLIKIWAKETKNCARKLFCFKTWSRTKYNYRALPSCLCRFQFTSFHSKSTAVSKLPFVSWFEFIQASKLLNLIILAMRAHKFCLTFSRSPFPTFGCVSSRMVWSLILWGTFYCLPAKNVLELRRSATVSCSSVSIHTTSRPVTWCSVRVSTIETITHADESEHWEITPSRVT